MRKIDIHGLATRILTEIDGGTWHYGYGDWQEVRQAERAYAAKALESGSIGLCDWSDNTMDRYSGTCHGSYVDTGPRRWEPVPVSLPTASAEAQAELDDQPCQHVQQHRPENG